MNISIKYFGRIAEITNCNEEELDFPGNFLDDLLQYLYLKYPKLKETDFQLAQNQIIMTENAAITNANVALLPPFAGG